MSLDAETSRLTTIGILTMKDGEILLDGFEGDNCTCRDVCVQAMVWAIGELQKALMADIQEPGGARHVIDVTGE